MAGVPGRDTISFAVRLELLAIGTVAVAVDGETVQPMQFYSLSQAGA